MTRQWLKFLYLMLQNTLFTMKKTLKLVGKIIISIIATALLYLFAAFILSKITIKEEANTSDDITIFVITNGVHTDVVVPAKNNHYDWTKEVKYSNAIAVDSTYNYLGMGWGDKEIYIDMPTWNDLTVPLAFRAATGLSTTAIHATYHKNLVENDTTIKMSMSNEQYSRLVKYIKKSFKTDETGHFINIKTNANYEKTDAFYEAIGSYSLFHTCNSWTNNALKASGQKSALWTPFDTGIFALYKSD